MAIACLIVVSFVVVFTMVRRDPPARAVPVTISSSDWLPYISAELPDNGPMAVMLSEVLGRAGYTPEFTFTTWPLAERDVRIGASIGMAPVIISPSRDEFALYSEPLLDFRYTLFGKKGDLLDSLPERTDLKGLTVARIAGYQYWEALDDSEAEFVDYPSALAAFEALQRGEVDLVTEGSVAGNAVLNGADFADDAELYAEASPQTDLTSSTQGLYLLLRDTPEGRTLRDQFNTALADYQNTEDYQRALDSLTTSSTRVKLNSADGGPVELFTNAQESAGFTPAGTAATVYTWPEGELGVETPVSVKLLEGPYAGRVLTARLEDVEMPDA